MPGNHKGRNGIQPLQKRDSAGAVPGRTSTQCPLSNLPQHGQYGMVEASRLEYQDLPVRLAPPTLRIEWNLAFKHFKATSAIQISNEVGIVVAEQPAAITGHKEVTQSLVVRLREGLPICLRAIVRRVYIEER